MKRVFFLCLALFVLQENHGQELRKEQYRPQYHLSPSVGWMGDPCGNIYLNGQYQLLWWGHAKSEDLVYWKEYNLNSMKGGPGDFAYFTGSAVVDTANSAGFNTAEDTTMIAIYSMHYLSNDIEKVGISFSHNNTTFNYYEGNPVLDSNRKFFGGPLVFWHMETTRWIMALNVSDKKTIEFYSSHNLKDWDYLSSFGLRGAAGFWEVPELIRLPVNGDKDSFKWVLFCGVGPNQIQYWVGDFNGTYFTLDSLDNHFTAKNIQGEVFADFDGEDYGNWQVCGTAFGSGPAKGTLPNQQAVNSYAGKGLVNTYNGGDLSTGKLISPEFTIEKKFINYLIGGGSSASTQIRLLVNDEVVKTGTSLKNQESLRWDGWDVSDWTDSIAHIEIVDISTEGWGHILVDHIVFSDELVDHEKEHANWIDWGKDFYAVRSFRNYSYNADTSINWIGWMGNWTYANNVPTVGWRGNQSVPRTLSLIYDDKAGYRIIQKPIEALQKLRSNNYSQNKTEIDGAMPLAGFQPDWNVFELKASFKISSDDQVFGLNLAEDGSGKKLVIGFDSYTSQLYVDRRKAGETSFSYSFPTICYAPVTLSADSILDLHIFMDQSSVEVFANNYQTVMSMLVFTKPSETGISLFSEKDPVSLLELQAWNIQSIWGVVPGDLTSSTERSLINEQVEITMYPNPLVNQHVLRFNTSEPLFIENGILEITNLTGSVIYSKEISGENLNDLTINDISNLPVGNYVVRIMSENLLYVRKLLILN